MVSKSLSAVWALFALSLLAASGILIAFSIVWGMPNMIIQFVVDGGFLKAGLVLGITYAVTFVVALIAIVQPNHITMGLSVLNWVLLLDSLGTIIVGSVIWFFTLKERSIFSAKWLVTSEPVRLAIQNQFSCCGYFGGNETGVAIGGFCANTTFAANPSTAACVGPLVQYADYTLNNIFTSVYGFMAILVGLFLASLCVINQRIEAERFRKIDSKRGGKGFV